MRDPSKITTYPDTAEASSVEWAPSEAVFLTAKAEWVKTGNDKNDPDGFVYLTDQRSNSPCSCSSSHSRARTR